MRGCPSCGEENPERARFCLGCGQELAAEEAAVPGVRRTVSVVFADLAGSTVLGESLDAEPLRYVTGRFFEAMSAAVAAHGGTVEKFIGDAVVAIFGLPRVREDDALRAVRAAADMRAALTQLNAELEPEVDVRLQIRIGVNTGEVVVGEARAGGSLATGDAVNVAARLEQAAEPGEVLLGDATYLLVRDHAEVTPHEPLALKGKAQPVPAWRLVGVAAASGRVTSRDTAFVGRDQQLRVLGDAFRRVTDEQSCQLVTVLAAAGMGKSRLAAEFATTVDDDATVLVGRCLSYGQGATYWPLREAVLEAAGLTGEERAEDAAAAIARALDGSPDTNNVVARLLALLGHHQGDSLPEDMGWAVRTFLEALAHRRPVVLVVDDLHWAEPGLLDLVDHITDWSRDAPIMLLGLARPEFLDSRPTWGGGKLNATSMLLKGLDESATAAVIQKHDLPEAVQHRIVEAAGGNPLFAEQLVAALVDEGRADSADGVVTWRADAQADAALTLPPSISALLAARIDQLGADERLVLGGAAVIGALFYVEAVTAIVGLPGAQVRQLLDGLVRRELLRPATSDLAGMSAYRFLHALVRDASYDGLTKQSRAQWHERLAEWLNGLDAVVPDEIVGHHLASAWDYWRQLGPSSEHSRALARRAGERLAAAARRLELSDAAAAAALCERAVAMLEPDDLLRAECLLALGQMRMDLGQTPQSRAALTEASASSFPAQALAAQVMLCRVNATFADHRVEDSRRVVADALERFAEWNDQRGLAWTHLVAAEIASFDSRIADSLLHLTAAREHARAAGDAGCAARARALVGIFHLFGPTPAEQAIATMEQLLVDSPGDPRVRGEVEQVTCVMHAMCGRFDLARQLSADCRLHLAEVGHGLFLANIAQSTAHMEELAGDLDAAERDYELSERDLLRLGESAYLSTVAGLHARLLVRRGKRTEGERALALAVEHGSPDDVMTQSLVLQAQALIAAQDGDAEQARHACRFLDLEDLTQSCDSAGEACLVAADVERLLGNPSAEREHLKSALAAFNAKGNVVRERQVAQRLSGVSA